MNDINPGDSKARNVRGMARNLQANKRLILQADETSIGKHGAFALDRDLRHLANNRKSLPKSDRSEGQIQGALTASAQRSKIMEKQ